jgi:hypothetical protein
MAIPKIPLILTKADWDRNKGIIAKIGIGETGIGAAMEKVRVAYEAVDWRKFDANMVFTGTAKTEEDVDKALAAAKNEAATKVEKLRAELRALEGLARAAEVKFKANRLVPHSATEHVAKIAVAADFMAVGCKSMDDEFKTFAAMKLQVRQRDEMVRKALLTYVAKMPPAISKLRSKPEVDAYASPFHKELVRGLAAALAHQKMTAFVPIWTKFSADSYKPKKIEEIKPKLAEIEKELAKLKSALA